MPKSKPELVEMEVIEEDPFEGIRIIPTGFLSNLCPFRGSTTIQYELDERCPPTVSAHVLPVTLKEELEPLGHPIPVVQEGTYCWTCLADRIREREAGIVIGARGGEHMGARRRRVKR